MQARTSASQVSKHDRTGRSKGEGPYIRHFEWMLRCTAYRSLTPNARCLLTELKRLYNGRNNGQLFLSIRIAAELLGVGKSTAQVAFKDLESRGFIRPAIKGSFHWKSRERHSTTWILTEYEYGNQPATKDFMKWNAVPAEVQSVPSQRRSVRAPVQQKKEPAHLSSMQDSFGSLNTHSVPETGHR